MITGIRGWICATSSLGSPVIIVQVRIHLSVSKSFQFSQRPAKVKGRSPFIRDESEVDDVLHDVLLQVWEHGNRYNPNEKGLRGLLVTLARRRALDRLRRKAAYRRATENLKTDTDNPLTFEIATISSEVEVNDLSKLLNRVIQELPDAQKEVIDLTFFKGMSQREIAAKRQISLGTVKTRLHLAQRKLYNFLMPMQHKI